MRRKHKKRGIGREIRYTIYIIYTTGQNFKNVKQH